MTIKYYYVGFSENPTFPDTDILSRFFAVTDMRVNSPNDANLLIIGNFIKRHERNIILNFRGIRVMYISEPITRLGMCADASRLYISNYCDYYIGCVSNAPKCIKYPLYAYEPIDFDSINSYVQTVDISGKKFCTLINRHDWGNTRVPIYNLLSKISNIVCPGKLLNNCSNIELNQIGNVEWCKKFVFNICSENFGASHPGYITEKLLNCVLGGAIPIYYGKLDDIDEQIFNKNRILFLTHENTSEVAKQVYNLVINPEKLIEFYKQPVFLPTAHYAYNHIYDGMKTLIAIIKADKIKNLGLKCLG